MNRKRNLAISAILLGSFFSGHALVVQSITNEPTTTTKVIEVIPEEPQAQGNIPDFAAITDVQSRKQSFFDFMQPLVTAENERVRSLRDSLDDMSKEQLTALATDYEISPSNPDLEAALLNHIDELPTSLVMAQAAIESAWGTSRFAQEGNNLFGEWCFSKGCGIVPKSRPAYATHEVRRFQSAEQSIRSYMHNLNTHKAYSMLRVQRADQRARQNNLDGCYLANGLQAYSQKGMGYVEMVKALIRGNQLETNKKHCAATVVAQPNAQSPKEEAPPNPVSASDSTDKESA